MESTVTLEEMRRLLDAVVDVGAGLDLPEILGRVVEAATELADARYGALGVLDSTGTRLEDFITVGIDAERRARIGSLPKGHGILGLIIDGDEPVRLDELHDPEWLAHFSLGDLFMHDEFGAQQEPQPEQPKDDSQEA